jgi:hypothetical protein
LFGGDAKMLGGDAKLFDELPPVVYEKFGAYALMTLAGQLMAIVGLVNKHSGELVEVAAGNRPDPDQGLPMAKWTLISAGQSLTADLPEQYWVWEDGLTAEERGETPFLVSEDENMLFHKQVRAVATTDEELKGLEPDWRRQRYRILCPCRNSDNYMWVRTGSVSSLGHLLDVLNDTFTANEIYYAYLHLPIVAVKRKQRRNKGALTGMPLPESISRRCMRAAASLP